MLNYLHLNNKQSPKEDNMSSYFYEKSKMYYEKYKAGKLVKKVDSIIKQGNKYLALVKDGKKAMFAGGSVDEGETTKQAVVREILEECGVKITKLKYLKKIYYSVDWEFEGTIFPNKRVTYIYLCKIENGDASIKGLEGEFNTKNISLKWCTYQELQDLDLWKPTLDLVKKIEDENIDI